MKLKLVPSKFYICLSGDLFFILNTNKIIPNTIKTEVLLCPKHAPKIIKVIKVSPLLVCASVTKLFKGDRKDWI